MANGAPDPPEIREATEELPDAWFVHAFASEAADGGDTGSSVRECLVRSGASWPSVMLRDPPRHEDPLVLADSGEIPRNEKTLGRFQVLGEIARGGMGVVMKGRDSDLGRDVALKLLLRSKADDPQMHRRFAEEAQIGGQLQHPGVVPVYESGTLPGGRPFFAMKLIKGETLAAQLRARVSTHADAPKFLRILAQVCQTVGYAHSRGVIHRDLKPSNVMTGVYGEVLVVDWGLAKVLDPGREPLREPQPPQSESTTTVETVRSGSPDFRSQAGMVMGTLAYMAPEQAAGRVDEVDERADVFSLGAILCEILTGAPPYAGRTAEAVRYEAVHGRLEGAQERIGKSGAETGLQAIVRRALARDPTERYSDASALADALLGHLATVELRSRESELQSAEARALDEENRALALQVRRVRRLGLGLLGLATVLVLGAIWINVSHAETTERKERETTARVALALEEAHRLAGEARGSATPDLAEWQRVLDAGARAREVALAGAAPADVLARADVLHAKLETEAAAARDEVRRQDADRTLKAALNRIRFHAAEEEGAAWWVTAYEKAFKNYGIDLAGRDRSEAVRRIRASSLCEFLCVALDLWAGELRFVATPEAAACRQQIEALVREADDDPWRKSVRDAFRTGDRETLLRYAASADAGSFSPLRAEHLALVLRLSACEPAAIVFLESAQREHPADFGVHATLAFLLANARPPRWKEAAQHYAAALALQPDSAAAWGGLASTLAWLQDLDGAEAAFAGARARAPEDPDVWNREGCYRLDVRDDPPGAIACFERAVVLEPGHSQAHFNLGNAHHATGDHAQARIAWEQAIRLGHPGIAARCSLALSLVRAGDMEGATVQVEEARRLVPRAATTWNIEGVILSEGRGDWEGAVRSFQHALECDPANPYIHKNLAQALARLGRLDAAIECGREALVRAKAFNANAQFRKRVNTADIAGQLAGVLMSAGRWQEAEDTIVETMAALPDDSSLQEDLLNIARARDDRQEAIVRHRERLAREPADALGSIRLARCLQASGDLPGALTVMKAAAQRWPSDRSVRLVEADVLFELGDLEVAEEAFAATNRIRPDFLAWDGIGRIALRRGDFAAALTAFRASFRLNVTHVAGRLGLGLTYSRMCALDEAAAALRPLALSHLRHLLALGTLAAVLDRLGHLEEAAGLGRRLREVAPGDPAHAVLLGRVLLAAGDLEGAAGAFRDAARLDTGNPEALLGAGLVLREAGRFEAALAELQEGRNVLTDDGEEAARADRWIEETERMAEFDRRLNDLVARGPPPTGAEECALIAAVGHARRRYADVLPFWHRALEQAGGAAPERIQDWALAAARSAAQAAGAATHPEEALRFRLQAAAWLRQGVMSGESALADQSRESRYRLIRRFRIAKDHHELRGLFAERVQHSASEDERRELRAVRDSLNRLIEEARPPAIEKGTHGP